MKLALKGHSIMVFASLILLASCKQQSGMEILNAQMSGLKALKSQYVVHREGQKDVLVNVLYSKPNRVLMTSEDFVVALNEIDGHFESIYSQKIYDSFPWDKRPFPGTGQLISKTLLSAGPPTASSPKDIVAEVPWKLEKKSGSIERYTKTVPSQQGPQTFVIEITDKGVPVQFISPQGISYVVKSFEIVDEIPIEKFRIYPKEGFVNHRVTSDVIGLQTGRQFSWSNFSAADNVKQFKLEGNTMFVIVDSSEPTSVNALNWIKAPGKGYRKVTISKGNASSGFYDPTGVEVDKLTSATPMFVMVDKDAKITGLWYGFDRDNVLEFEKDIQKVVGKTP